MGFMPAVEISYIRPKNQRLIAVSIDGEQASPSLAQSKKLRELDKDGKLNGDVIDGILSEKKKEDAYYILYSFVANLISFGAGLFLAAKLPGMF